MKTLFLCVDRDDDLGAKAGVQSPVVGRRRNLEAALALGLADPEDSDTNAILAAVHLHDRELAAAQEAGDQVEVATVTGLRTMGYRGDRKLAEELDKVLATTRPDQVVLVSDGAEDERILPILQSRAKIVHVHRSVVKQAPRLEGFYYTITRMLDEPKQARRFVLPVAIIAMAWGAAYLLGYQAYALGATLAFIGVWLLIHALQWEAHVGRVLTDLGQGARRGRIALLANLLLLVFLALGAVQAWQDLPSGPETTSVLVLLFLRSYFPYILMGFLIQALGRLLDGWARGGRSGFGPVMTIIALLAFGFVADALFAVSLALARGEDLLALVNFEQSVRIAIGITIALGGILLGRYLRRFQDPAAS